jgi:hypothetical protein
VARLYAGIFGCLAFLTTLARGAVCGGSTTGILWAAWGYLWAFAAVGLIVGWIAKRTIEQSVRDQVAARLAEEESRRQGAGADDEDASGQPATGATERPAAMAGA